MGLNARLLSLCIRNAGGRSEFDIHGLVFVMDCDVCSMYNRTEGYVKEEVGREVREAKQSLGRSELN
jgi:hypothetical protein